MPDRFEREIDEILKKIDDFPRGAQRRRRGGSDLGRRVGAMQRSLAVRLAHLGVSQIMLTALGLMVGSYLLHGLLGRIWVYGLTLGLILFFTAFFLSFRSGGPGRGSEPYFRGRPRSYYGDGSSLGARLREWWRQRRYRR